MPEPKQLASYRGRPIVAIDDINLKDLHDKLEELHDKLEEIRAEQATQHTALLAKLDDLIAAVSA